MITFLNATKTMNLKAIIVDDEKPSREALLNYTRDYCPDVEVVDECNSTKTAYKSILKHNPQLVFLDIEMPNGDGFDLLRLFGHISFKVIFVTAYSEHALKAFRYSATDYLLKPVMVEELIEAVNKVKKDIAMETDNLNIQKLLENLSAANSPVRQLVIPDSSGFKVLDTSSVILCEADGYCTHFHLTGRDKLTSSKNLKHYEELLSSQGFFRVHNSWMINLAHVRSFSNQGEILLSGDFRCPLGNAYRQSFLERFKRLK
jgi:two-component system LytT family response regulator